MITIRLFHAASEPELANRFAEEHVKTLKDKNLDIVNSASSDWVNDNDAFGVIAENEEGQIICGLKMLAHNGIRPFPLEASLGSMDENIYSFVSDLSYYGAAEMCGLFFSSTADYRAHRHLIYLIAIAGIAAAPSLGIKKLTGIAPRHTQRLWKSVGFVEVPGLGDEGIFYYPSKRYPTKVMDMDAEVIDTVPEEGVVIINKLRNKMDDCFHLCEQVKENKEIRFMLNTPVAA